jgi:hypothetical protein
MSVFKEHLSKNLDLRICHTVDVFNVYYLPEFLDWSRGFGLSVYLNNLHEPKHYNVSTLPHYIKVKIREKLANYKQTNLENIINFMMNSSNNQLHFDMLKAQINRIDIVRSESFEKTFPDLYRLIYEPVML